MSGCVEETTQKILTCEYEGAATVKFVYVFDTADFDKENKVAEAYEVWVQPNEERTKVITKTTDTEVIPYEVTPTSLRFFSYFKGTKSSIPDAVVNRGNLSIKTIIDEMGSGGSDVGNQGCSLENYGSGVKI
jgi:hypothetical protein